MSGYQQILNTAWPSSLDSFEGVPDLFEPRVPLAQRPRWQRVPHEALVWAGAVLPGIALAAFLAFCGKLLSDWIGINLLHFDREKGSPLSPIMLAILLGLVIRNSFGVPVAYEQGLRLCMKTVLRVGIVLLGLKLSLGVLGKIGLLGVPVIVICIATALLAVTFINRALGLPKRLGTLIAVGTSICGVSAIVATAPVIDAEEDETSYAVACITIFGMLALFTYPFLAHWLFQGNETAVGLFLGTSIHDTSQVAGAGLIYKQQHVSEEVLKTAMAVKLMRNVSMSLLIPLMAVLYHRSSAKTSGTPRRRQKWHELVPMFVFGFVVMAALRTIGDRGDRAFGVLEPAAWQSIVQGAETISIWCLTIAMAAVGLATGLAKLKGLGWKPFSVGLAAAALVGGVSVVAIKVMERLVLP